MPKIQLKSVRTGDVLDEIILDREGTIQPKGRMAREMVAPHLDSGMTGKEVFDYLDGWSNGYVQARSTTPPKE